MEQLKATTKKAQQLINNYLCANASTLYECYGSHSQAKENAFDYCEGKRQEFNGWGRRVCTYCTCFFTYGCRVGDHDLIYITPTHDYYIENAF